VRSQADEADLASITPEMLVVMRCRRDQGREAQGEVPQGRQPRRTSGLMRIAKEYERGKAASKAIGEQTASKTAADGGSGPADVGRTRRAPDRRPEGAGFPKEFYKKHADEPAEAGEMSVVRRRLQRQVLRQEVSEMLCTHCSKKGHLKEVCATLAWEKSGQAVQQAKGRQRRTTRPPKKTRAPRSPW
jgi:hypothetical protein